MATTTPTRKRTPAKPTTATDTTNELLLAAATFVEGIASDSKRYFADTVTRYEDVATVLRPHYEQRDKAWKAEQTNRGVAADKLTDYPVSKWHSVLVDSVKGFGMTEANLRDVRNFWMLHSPETFAGYTDSITTDRKHGSWTGYLAFCADVQRDYITSDGSETGKRPAKRTANQLSADDVVQLTTTDFVAETEAPNDVERLIIASKRLHDFTWQVAEAMGRLTPDQQKLVRKAVKEAINTAKVAQG